MQSADAGEADRTPTGTNVRTRPKLRQRCLSRTAAPFSRWPATVDPLSTTRRNRYSRSVIPGALNTWGIGNFIDRWFVRSLNAIVETGATVRLIRVRIGGNMAEGERDWTKPVAIALSKEDYFERERGRYGPVYSRTPACPRSCSARPASRRCSPISKASRRIGRRTRRRV